MPRSKTTPKPPKSVPKSPPPSRSHRTRRRPRRPPSPVSVAAAPPVPIPEIIVGFDEEAVANAGIAALGACPELFTHAGQLVTLIPRSDAGTPLAASRPVLQIERLPTPRLRELLSRSARWLVPLSDAPDESVLSHVPQWVVSAIAARRHWPGLRPLTALVSTPVLRPDGTVLDAPGYDPATGLYLALHANHLPIPVRPTKAAAQLAADSLLATVIHVPFATPVDRAAWLAMVLTPLARFALGAAAPLCVVEDSPRAQWSDDLIADLAALAGANTPAAVDADDLLGSPRRLIDALRANGDPVARITNGLTRTATAWRRICEALQRARATEGLVWLAATFRPTRDVELPRYALTLRCESAVTTPPGEHEPQFDEPASHLLVAALTILRAYQVAGRPNVGLPRWPGFERWSQVVRAAIVWIGLPDPMRPFDAAPMATSATEAAVADLVVGWSELAPEFPGGGSTRQALDALSSTPPERYPRLRAAVAVFAPGPLDARSTADRLSRCLTRYRDEQHEGHALVLAGSGNLGNRWAVRSVPVVVPVEASALKTSAPPPPEGGHTGAPQVGRAPAPGAAKVRSGGRRRR